ncbi:hypothetical protein KAFR_0G01270 [Kazachstania africana CBS 2517]|uniref:DNA replication complex GINS protein SLD5 n=1 Tax=Kazachstania africana (strain ATCC 22294 / BCRC 22015 / CBS 2517 / CECT 1963 / NBRC 1671 / NRRL Y-8276) TaxID=1071382 RepID=H2AXR1_KAZAF|nr:hypothetical protein KAFR_0G01270 [Kazachstania africana CBS 2517]CCF59161.1 hypothetical protein KAFR_0G01270 [Kazachstania africana CBS 2517]
MDVNIDDILAELDQDTTAVDYKVDASSSQNAINSTNDQTVLNSSLTNTKIQPTISLEKDYKLLLRHWQNERFSPELLPYPHLLMERLLRRVSTQIESIELISMNLIDNDNVDTSKNGNNLNMLPLLVMEAELERVKFVIRSFIRCRLSKIDKFSLYLRTIRDNEGGNDRSINGLLSESEVVYHQKHFNILLKIFNNSILQHLPSELQAINDTEGSVNMIDAPDWDKFVFVLVTGPPNSNFSEDPLLIKSQDKFYYNVTVEELNEDIELTVGSIYVLRYSVIKTLLTDGKVQLI